MHLINFSKNLEKSTVKISCYFLTYQVRQADLSTTNFYNERSCIKSAC